MRNIYLKIARSGPRLKNLILATVTATRGSTPQKPGSHALFSSRDLIEGTVGGGYVEKEVCTHAGDCSITGESKYLHFTLDNPIDRKEEPICGGSISILLDADPLSHQSLFEKMEQDLAKGHPGILVTVVTTLKEPLVSLIRYWVTAESGKILPDYLADKIAPEIKRILSASGSQAVYKFELSNQEGAAPCQVLLEPVYPLPRLVIAGAGHIGKALSHLGKMLDFEVTVADSRSEYANAINLPDADHIVAGNIGNAMEEIIKDRFTYIVIMTHGHADDSVALRPCIGTDAAYVGMIGSKGKIAKMREEFLTRKWATEEEWRKIYSPVGIEIGSKTVEEIAVSIAAQLVLVRSRMSCPPDGGLKAESHV